MVFSYNWLQSFFPKKLPRPEKLAEFLNMKAFEVEEIKRIGGDHVLNIDVTPNRAGDCFSHLGIAREISAILGLNYQTPPLRIIENKRITAKDFISVEVEDKIACHRYTAKVVYDVKVGPSPKWMQQRLKICGLKPVNNIVDIANYVMLETGQPLHVFDFDKLEIVNPKSQIKKIIVRFAKKKEKIVTLDEEKYDLDEDVLVIADEKKPLAIAGIKGGIIAEITKKTKVIVLESANFNRINIRRASQKLNLKTDASLRFEHGLDLNLTELAINRAAFLIQKIAKGKVASQLIDFHPHKFLPKRIKLNLDYVEKLLGIKISQKETLDILKRLGFKILSKNYPENKSRISNETGKLKTNNLLIEIPSFRLDISIPEDLIEEVGRIYGFEKIPAKFPIAVLVPPRRNLDIFWEDISKNILKETGFTEVYNYSFVSEKEAKDFSKEGLIEIKNPTSLDFQYLRPSLIPNLLKNVVKNQKNFEEIKIFELGKIFRNKKEKRMLSGIITGEEFYQMKGVVDLLLNKLGISNIWYDDYRQTPEESKIAIWHPQKCAEIKINHQEVGFLGQISQRTLEKFKISQSVVVFDIDFEKLRKLCSEETIYQPISRFPAAVRDLAVLVPRGTKVVEVLNKINVTGGSLVKDVDLFDIYEGEELPQGKKNLAFHIIYQSELRTLKSEEIDKIQQKIIKALEEDPEWEARK